MRVQSCPVVKQRSGGNMSALTVDAWASCLKTPHDGVGATVRNAFNTEDPISSTQDGAQWAILNAIVLRIVKCIAGGKVLPKRAKQSSVVQVNANGYTSRPKCLGAGRNSQPAVKKLQAFLPLLRQMGSDNLTATSIRSSPVSILRIPRCKRNSHRNFPRRRTTCCPMSFWHQLETSADQPSDM